MLSPQSSQFHTSAQLPSSCGTLTAAEFPSTARVETWVERGIEVSPFYDPMLAKIIMKAENGDILRFHQFLWAYDQSEARIESQSEAIEGKVGK
jgi:biotin carboxylase